MKSKRVIKPIADRGGGDLLPLSKWLVLTDPTSPIHGTYNGYKNYGCMCDRCRAAQAATHRANGPQGKYRNRYRGLICSRVGCTRGVALANPSHGLCHRHLKEAKR